MRLVILIVIISIIGCSNQNQTPKKAIEMNNKAVKLILEKKYDEAINQINEVIFKFPNYKQAYYNKMTFLANANKYEEALSFSKSLLNNDKLDKALIYTFIAYESYKKGKLERASLNADKAIEIYSRREDNYFNNNQIAHLKAMQGKFDEACIIVNRLIKNYPKKSDILEVTLKSFEKRSNKKMNLTH